MSKQQNPALQTTDGFSQRSQELARTETASTAVAAQAKAAVESRYIMAMNRPRNWDDVRTNILKECRRPSFAQSALYNKPVGQGIVGFSIRFVESALRCMTNILPEVATVYDDSGKKIVRVTVTDLEANLTYSKDVTVTKSVERSKPLADGSYISVRTNSYGKPVYEIPGTDDDILNKENALVSKAIRTLGLRLVPGDILDEAFDLVVQTARNQTAEDPDAARKKLVDAFATLNVTASMLEKYLDQPLASVSPSQLVELRGLFSAIRDDEATWKEVMDERAKAGQGCDDKGPKRKSAKAKPENAAKDEATQAEHPEQPDENGPMTQGHIQLLEAKLQAAKLTSDDLFGAFSVVGWDDLRAGQVNDCLEWIAGA